MQTIGHLRSGLNHTLAEVLRHEDTGYYHGYPVAPGMVQAYWLSAAQGQLYAGPPRFLGYAKTDAEARRLLGHEKAKELRLLYSLSSNCRAQKARLNHSPDGPSLIFPKAKAVEPQL